MLRLILITILFLLSLLTVFRAPMALLWYVSILVTEFCWIFFAIVCVLLCWRFGAGKYQVLSLLLGLASLTFFAIPIKGAYSVAAKLRASPRFAGSRKQAGEPFSFWKMITSSHERRLPFQTLIYDHEKSLTLDFYKSAISGNRPCIIVVHGGSWAGGESGQLPELNTVLSKAGYHVASINYRLAPRFIYPAPIEDLQSTLNYLRSQSASLSIDTNQFVLLGRSAGGQIVLSAACTLHDAGIRGVISFYGPADMIWGYMHPTNPLVLNSRKVIEDYLGGTYKEVPQQYVQSSATETASRSLVPVLLIHGENDPLVSYEHTVRLAAKLDSLGTPHYELYLPWATHGFDWTLHGPAGQLSTWSVLQFLTQVVKKED